MTVWISSSKHEHAELKCYQAKTWTKVCTCKSWSMRLACANKSILRVSWLIAYQRNRRDEWFSHTTLPIAKRLWYVAAGVAHGVLREPIIDLDYSRAFLDNLLEQFILAIKFHRAILNFPVLHHMPALYFVMLLPDTNYSALKRMLDQVVHHGESWNYYGNDLDTDRSSCIISVVLKASHVLVMRIILLKYPLVHVSLDACRIEQVNGCVYASACSKFTKLAVGFFLPDFELAGLKVG